MENIELLKQINRIQQSLIKNGIVVDKLIEEIKTLRAFFIEEKMPRMVKILRLTYEHLENYKTFNISMPEDEGSDSESTLSIDDQRVESLAYLIALFEKPTQKLNAEDLDYYLDAFKSYSENH
ncbi:MAG: hypothetical protein PF517_00880 [Salinivirgaceae bacterium]|nr:hypothetical protein [Salinivirgaceae bacterium]